MGESMGQRGIWAEHYVREFLSLPFISEFVYHSLQTIDTEKASFWALKQAVKAVFRGNVRRGASTARAGGLHQLEISRNVVTGLRDSQ